MKLVRRALTPEFQMDCGFFAEPNGLAASGQHQTGDKTCSVDRNHLTGKQLVSRIESGLAYN